MSEVLGVDTVAIEDMVFVPLDDLGAVILPAKLVLVRDTLDRTFVISSSSEGSLMRAVLPRSPFAGSNTLSTPGTGALS
jgi:hypothetical protein